MPTESKAAKAARLAAEAAAAKAVVIDADVLKEWRADKAQYEPKYVLDSTHEGYEFDDFESVNKDSPFGDKPFRLAKFIYEGEEFSFPVHRNRELDEDLPISIRRFKAKETFVASNGKTIKMGTTRWMAIQS